MVRRHNVMISSVRMPALAALAAAAAAALAGCTAGQGTQAGHGHSSRPKKADPRLDCAVRKL
eukprot:SAG22_NODE_2615_length_2375_cov_10.619947_1_plen_61_part_10